jgi:hypothetical protein
MGLHQAPATETAAPQPDLLFVRMKGLLDLIPDSPSLIPVFATLVSSPSFYTFVRRRDGDLHLVSMASEAAPGNAQKNFVRIYLCSQQACTFAKSIGCIAVEMSLPALVEEYGADARNLLFHICHQERILPIEGDFLAQVFGTCGEYKAQRENIAPADLLPLSFPRFASSALNPIPEILRELNTVLRAESSITAVYVGKKDQDTLLFFFACLSGYHPADRTLCAIGLFCDQTLTWWDAKKHELVFIREDSRKHLEKAGMLCLFPSTT